MIIGQALQLLSCGCNTPPARVPEDTPQQRIVALADHVLAEPAATDLMIEAANVVKEKMTP